MEDKDAEFQVIMTKSSFSWCGERKGKEEEEEEEEEEGVGG